MFVERDSKHRRVMSNFGLTFRNSKWSDYAVKNVTLSSRDSFFRWVFNVFTILFYVTLAISICYYYNSQSQFNELTYQLWSFFDETFYLFSFLLWLFSYSVVFFSKVVHDNLFNFFYNTTDSVSSRFTNSTSNNSNEIKFKPAKNLHSPLFLSWLNSSKDINTVGNSLEELASSYNHPSNWNIYQQLFKNLYLSSYNLSSINDVTKLSNTHLSEIGTISHLTHPFANYVIGNNASSESVKNIFITNSINVWNLNSLSSEVNKYNNLVLGKTGSFYLNDLNFNKLNQLITNSPELSSLTSSMINQTKVIKWNRWLYRYNVLHRKTVKNSHKLTMVKKLITTGFYDSSLTSNNIWASDFFSKNKQSTKLIHSQFNLLYKNTFNNNNSETSVFNNISLNSTNTSLNMLQFYEKSYFWFVKRFYLFNTLSTNAISSDVTLVNNKPVISPIDEKNQSNDLFSLILNNLLRSHALTNSNLNPSYITTELNLGQNVDNSSHSSTKDIAILVNEIDLLNTDNLELLLNLNSNITSSHNNVSFFNVNSYADISSYNTNLTLNTKKHPKTYSYNSNYSTIDKNLLLDLYILSTLRNLK